MKSNEFAWRDVKVVIAGRPITGIRGVKYKTSRVVDKIFAGGDEAHSKTKGNKTPTGELVLLQSELEALQITAKANGGQDVTDLTFDIIVNYSKSLLDAMVTDHLVECDILEFEKGMLQGNPNMEITLPLDIGKINYNI